MDKIQHRAQSVAIIDDSKENILELVGILEDICVVMSAATGKKGLELIFAQNPDVVLVDAKLEDMDGVELCRNLKADPRTEDIPIVFISSSNSDEDERLGLTAGAIDFIHKPFSPLIVKVRIMNHLRMKEQSDVLRNLSMTDGLTGLANRRQLDKYLDAEWRRCSRISAPFSLIMIDIDYFKPYNDSYGHLQGDECLKAVAKTLSTTIQRPGDILARFGGEEFLAILPGIELKGAVHLAEKMRQSVSSLGLPHKASIVADHVTISAGVATELSCRDKSTHNLVKLADDQLYRAKSSGRNRVASPLRA